MLDSLIIALAIGGGLGGPGGIGQDSGEAISPRTRLQQARELQQARQQEWIPSQAKRLKTSPARAQAPTQRKPGAGAQLAQTGPKQVQGMGGSSTRLGAVSATDKAKANQGAITQLPFYYTVQFFGGASGTGTGYKERFMIFTPPQGKPSPMLVVFHRFGVSELDAFVSTSFFQEAWSRGWHIVAPLSASGVNFGAPLTQINTEFALEWMVDNFNVRDDRIYGVGFSMGGGTALSYAARHLDPTKPMFAAVVDHTGGIALNDTYDNEPAAQFIFDFWFGNGSPGSASAWAMRASSMFDFDRNTKVVDTTSDMARNLQHMPVKVFYATEDPLAYLTVQSSVLATHLAAQGTQTKLEVVSDHAHSWDTLSEFKTINWLSKKVLTLPLSGRTLAARNGRYFFITVQQVISSAFTSYDWDIDIPGNTLTVSNTANLSRAAFATLEAGLDPTSTLTVDMSTSVGNPVEYILRDYTVAPSQVLRDGLPTAAYVFDPVGMDLTLQETDGANHVWQILP